MRPHAVAGDERRELQCLSRLGEACVGAGEAASGVAYYEQALPVARGLVDADAEMTALLGLSAALGV